MASSFGGALTLRIALALVLTASPLGAAPQSRVAVGSTDAAAKTASPEPTRRPHAIDVELQEGDLLIGQLVDTSGQPESDITVKLTLGDGREASAKTNKQGGFAFRGVKGVATVATDEALVVARVWQPTMAPPSATPALLMVQGKSVARGQYYPQSGTQRFVDRSKRLLANPLFVAGLVATAVAVPLAIANDDDDPASP